MTGRYLGGERRDLTVSYVRSHGSVDLNNYDQFYGNLRNPIVRPNEHNLIPTDVPHRLLVRGTIGLPGQWDFAPVLEVRSGFPWSAVDEFQDFVGERNRAGRLPRVRTFDFSLVSALAGVEVPLPRRTSGSTTSSAHRRSAMSNPTSRHRASDSSSIRSSARLDSCSGRRGDRGLRQLRAEALLERHAHPELRRQLVRRHRQCAPVRARDFRRDVETEAETLLPRRLPAA